MTAAELLAELRWRGVRVAAEGEELVCDDSGGVLTERVVAAIRAAKEPLQRLLAIERQADCLIAQTYRELGDLLPGGAVPWADRCRPDLTERLDRATEEWAAAYEAGDLNELRAALSAFLDAAEAIATAWAAVDPTARARAALTSRRTQLQQRGDRMTFIPLPVDPEAETPSLLPQAGDRTNVL